MNSRPLQKWEEELNMRVHRSKVKEARHPRKTNKTRDVQRNLEYLSIKDYLKQFDLLQYKKKIEERFEKPHDLLELTQKEIESLASSLNLYPGHSEKFRKMVSEISSNSFKFRSNTAVFSTLSPTVFSNFGRESEPKPSLESKVLNQQLKSELSAAKAKLASLQVQVTSKSYLPECEVNQRIDKTNTGKSFDSSMMRSTLHNMDLEELCRCFARTIENQCNRQSNKGTGLLREVNSVFVDENSDEPLEENIYNWIRNVISKGKIEKEAVVNALAYLERYAQKSEINICTETWKKLSFISLFLASKLGKHHHESFLQIFDENSIDKMERNFLMLIEYNLKIRQSEYAHAYFLLRTYTTNKDKSAPIKFLKVDKVLELQKAVIPEEDFKKTFLKSL